MLCASSALDIFAEPPVNASVEKTQWVSYQPLSSLQSGPLEFFCPAQGDFYTDLSKTLLHVKVKVVKEDGSAITEAQAVSTANGLFNSLFSKVDVFLNDCQMTDSNVNYGYKSYIQTVINYSSEAKNTQLSTQLFITDEDQAINAMKAKAGGGYLRRKNAIAGSRSVELCGKLHVDCCQLDRYILDNVAIKFVFTRAKPQFVLICEEANAAFKIDFQSASLYLRKVKIAPSIQLAHARVLQDGAEAIYPMSQTVLKNFVIPAGLSDITRENLWHSRLPNRVLVALTASSGFNGEYGKNPYNFGHYDLNYVTFHLNGEQIPAKPFTPDFQNKHYVREFLSVFEAINYLGRNKGFSLTYDSYKAGSVMYSLDLTSDETAGSACAELNRTGSLGVEIKFANPLAENVTCLILAEFEATMKIDRNRNVSVTPVA